MTVQRKGRLPVEALSEKNQNIIIKDFIKWVIFFLLSKSGEILCSENKNLLEWVELTVFGWKEDYFISDIWLLMEFSLIHNT